MHSTIYFINLKLQNLQNTLDPFYIVDDPLSFITLPYMLLNFTLFIPLPYHPLPPLLSTFFPFLKLLPSLFPLPPFLSTPFPFPILPLSFPVYSYPLPKLLPSVSSSLPFTLSSSPLYSLPLP